MFLKRLLFNFKKRRILMVILFSKLNNPYQYTGSERQSSTGTRKKFQNWLHVVSELFCYKIKDFTSRMILRIHLLFSRAVQFIVLVFPIWFCFHTLSQVFYFKGQFLSNFILRRNYDSGLIFKNIFLFLYFCSLLLDNLC